MKNIVLTGLMGSGKSSVGLALKQVMPDYDFIETDLVIVDSVGISINEIFKTRGEKYFREIEKNIIDEILKKQNQIISLGGGSLENNFNFFQARENSIIFYLKADVEILYERIKNNKERPLLNCDNPLKKLKELLNVRKLNYEKADYTIDVNNKTVKEIAEEIVRIYKNEL